MIYRRFIVLKIFLPLIFLGACVSQKQNSPNIFWADEEPKDAIKIGLQIHYPDIYKGPTHALDQMFWSVPDPYFIGKAWYIIDTAFKNIQISFRKTIYYPNDELHHVAYEELIKEFQSSDMQALGLFEKKDDRFYCSEPVITRHYYAITMKKDRIHISSLEDLLKWKGKIVASDQALKDLDLTKLAIPPWPNTWQKPGRLGGTEKILIAEKDDLKDTPYTEGDDGDLAQSNSDLHDIFTNKIMNYYVCFKDSALRDQFNKGLNSITPDL
ncbi:MAG: hypothetical protein IPJ69_00245 [Deltaproteobacteria bacterium]|nr:MAG: hypothetical protein IPJ69_00245 [Deltaproteobacteria bacterium]